MSDELVKRDGAIVSASAEAFAETDEIGGEIAETRESRELRGSGPFKLGMHWARLLRVYYIGEPRSPHVAFDMEIVVSGNMPAGERVVHRISTERRVNVLRNTLNRLGLFERFVNSREKALLFTDPIDVTVTVKRMKRLPALRIDGRPNEWTSVTVEPRSSMVTERTRALPLPGNAESCASCGHKFMDHNYSDADVVTDDPYGKMYECRGAGMRDQADMPACGCLAFKRL